MKAELRQHISEFLKVVTIILIAFGIFAGMIILSISNTLAFWLIFGAFSIAAVWVTTKPRKEGK